MTIAASAWATARLDSTRCATRYHDTPPAAAPAARKLAATTAATDSTLSLRYGRCSDAYHASAAATQTSIDMAKRMADRLAAGDACIESWTKRAPINAGARTSTSMRTVAAANTRAGTQRRPRDPPSASSAIMASHIIIASGSLSATPAIHSDAGSASSVTTEAQARIAPTGRRSTG